MLDLLLTDVVLPRLSGPRLATELRELKPDLKVLYHSGYEADSDALDATPSCGFVPKPFTGSMIAQHVREFLDRAG